MFYSGREAIPNIDLRGESNLPPAVNHLPSTSIDDNCSFKTRGFWKHQLARCLQRLGEIGITVLCVIHQPRFFVFQTFSHVMLLAPGGRVAYVGKADDTMEYFFRQGFRLPKGENVADWLVDIIDGRVPRYFQSGVIDKDFKAADLLNMWKLEVACPGRDVPGGLTRRESVNRLSDILPRHPRERFQPSLVVDMPPCVQQVQDFFLHLWTNQFDESGSIPQKRRRGTRLRGKMLDTMLKKSVSLEDFLSFTHHLLLDASVQTWVMVLEDIGGDANGIPLQTLLMYFRNQVNRATSNVQQVSLEVQNDSKSEVLRQRVTPNFFMQLKCFLSRDIHKFSLILLLFTVCLTLAFSILTGISLHNKFEYKDIVARQFRPVTLLCILTSATQLTLFGSERLMFKREVSSGISASAYWAAKNVWGLVDLVAISFIFTVPWVYLTSADFGLLKGWVVCLLLSWWSQGFGFFVSVGFKDNFAILIAVGVPAVVNTLFAGVDPRLPDLSRAQTLLSACVPGRWAVELLFIWQVEALPDNVQKLQVIEELWTRFGYEKGNQWICVSAILILGTICRAGALVVLYLLKYNCVAFDSRLRHSLRRVFSSRSS